MSGAPSFDVAVVGSVNEDLVVSVEAHPEPGETVLGDDWFSNPGGKGANQAVAAARLGRSVAFVGAIGNDVPGELLRQALLDDGVDVGGLAVVEAPTGRAFITVETGGENRIVVSPGANGRVTAEQVSASASIAAAKVVLTQLEVPVEAVAAAADAATGIVVLNPAPARALPESLLQSVDVLVPNRGELALLVGEPAATSSDGLAEQAKRLGVERVVVTLGADGALVIERGAPTEVPPVKAQSVDTTAAGDSFCGALADALAEGAELVDAARWGARVAAVTVTRRGAQASLPTRDEVQ